MSNTEHEIVITGINGFVGEHLARQLKNTGHTVHGVGREQKPKETVAHLLDKYTQCDLMDRKATRSLSVHNTSAIIHLAGLASVADSFKFPDRYKKDNSTMTDNLLSSAKEQGFTGRTVVISTGAIYDPNQSMPLKEDALKTQGSPYSAGKIAAEETAKTYKGKGLDIVIARPFNHIGPGQASGFLVSDLYDQILGTKDSRNSVISVGNINTRRDFTDVRDIVKAYGLLADAPSLQYDTYNISSGNSYSGKDILDQLSKEMRIAVTAEIDPARVRPTDAPEIVGDSTRIREELHWSPSISLEQTISDFVTWKRDSVS
ncbi:MAG: nucleoside-diphosphate-sugar epimerase [Candidatus Saccharibacteria bacterium]|nr:nucleoside-diphosphate-sugar epimerase [Candidatus Saccharibacteria bacterium]